jgi:hypothetical protein
MLNEMYVLMELHFYGACLLGSSKHGYEKKNEHCKIYFLEIMHYSYSLLLSFGFVVGVVNRKT